MIARFRRSKGRRRADQSQKKPRRGSRLGGFLRRIIAGGRLPAFLLSVGLAVIAFGFLFSQDFVVRTIIVQGNTLALADSIVTTSDALDQQIFHIDTQAVARRVAALPAVASVEVSAELPDRLIIRVHERAPVIIWQTGDQAMLVDQHGWVLAKAGDQTLPRVLQTEGDSPVVGSRIEPEVIQALLAVNQRLGPQLMTLEYDHTTGITAHFSDGHIVMLGTSDQIPVKLNVLDAAMAIQDQWHRLDLREPDRPAYK
jgi:cell division protein FtsQ